MKIQALDDLGSSCELVCCVGCMIQNYIIISKSLLCESIS